MWLLVLCRRRAVQSMGAQGCAAQAVPLLLQKPDAPDDACLSHASDSVVFCGTSTTGPFFDEELRLIGATGTPDSAT